jgi:hypothetical protein
MSSHSDKSDSRGMQSDMPGPAPGKRVSVRPGGNGDMFVVTESVNDDDRDVLLLNNEDARTLKHKLTEELGDA